MVDLPSIEEENKVIDSIGNIDFYNVMLDTFGPVGLVSVLGYATLYGLTGKHTVVEARYALVKLGLSERAVYNMYQDFRRLRRALLLSKNVIMREPGGGPGTNAGVPPIIERVKGLQPV